MGRREFALRGEHPIAAVRVPGLLSDHETRTLLPKSTVSRRRIAGADYQLEPNRKKCPAVAKRGGYEGIPYLSESRLSSRTRRATLVGGRSPNDCHRRDKNERVVKTNHKKKALTFGNFIAAVYDACGQRRARAIVRLAVNAHVVAFRGHRHFVIS